MLRLYRIGSTVLHVAQGSAKVGYSCSMVLLLHPLDGPLKTGKTEIDRRVVAAPVHVLPRHLVRHDEGHDAGNG